MTQQPTVPIILIPGIKGTTLVNTNSLDFDTIWSGIQSKFETIQDLELQEDPDHENEPLAIVERGDVEDLGYAEAVRGLERMSPDQLTRVYIFGYDWRKSCRENGKNLFSYVQRLQKKLGVKTFNFLTHSMGGLVFSCFLTELQGDYTAVNKAALTVCPFLGSVNALIALIAGEGGINFPLFNSNEAFRKISRTFPSVYELCPVYPGAVNFETAAKNPFDIHDTSHWQSNIRDNAIFKARLDHLKKIRTSNPPAMFPLDQLPAGLRKKLIIIAGKGEDDTKVRVTVKDKGPNAAIGNFFDFDARNTDGDGDGTVPIESSTCYKNSITTLAIKSRWYNLAHRASFHAFFLNDSRSQNIIKRFFLDKDSKNPEWWQDASGSVQSLSNLPLTP